MRISLKNSLSNWIKVGENDKGESVEFLIDYPTVEQQELLDELKYDAYGKMFNLKSPDEMKLDLVKFLKYKKNLIRYCVKDWKGLEDKCEVKENQLEENLWKRLTRDESMVHGMFDLISKEIEFSNTDKKKFSSAES